MDADNFLFQNLSGSEQARQDKKKLKKAGIKSPDHRKMYKIQRPDGTCYYFKTRAKYEKNLEKFRKIDEKAKEEAKRKEERLKKIREQEILRHQRKGNQKGGAINDKRCILF